MSRSGRVRDDRPPVIAVMTAFEPETVVLRALIDDADIRCIKGVEFVSGRIEGKDVLVFQSGISMVNAAMMTQMALGGRRASASRRRRFITANPCPATA